MRKFLTTTAAALLVSATAACSAVSVFAADNTARASRAEVVYLNVGQSRIVLPAASLQRAEQPYALSGQTRASDAWQREGHWINAGQTRVYVPPTQPQQ